MDRLGHDALGAGFLLGGQLLQRFPGGTEAFPCRSLHAAQGRGGKAKASEALLHGGDCFFHCNKQHITVPLVLVDLKKLALLVDLAQGSLHIGKLHLHRDGAHEHTAALRPLGIQGQVQPQPGLETFHNAALAALLGADALDACVIALDGPGKLQGAAEAGIVKECQILQLRLCGKQLALFGGICIQQSDGVVETGELRLERCYIAALPAEDAFHVGALDLVLQLRKLHTAVADQFTQQLVLPGTDSHEPELFHF